MPYSLSTLASRYTLRSEFYMLYIASTGLTLRKRSNSSTARLEPRWVTEWRKRTISYILHDRSISNRLYRIVRSAHVRTRIIFIGVAKVCAPVSVRGRAAGPCRLTGALHTRIKYWSRSRGLAERISYFDDDDGAADRCVCIFLAIPQSVSCTSSEIKGQANGREHTCAMLGRGKAAQSEIRNACGWIIICRVPARRQLLNNNLIYFLLLYYMKLSIFAGLVTVLRWRQV